MHDPETLDALIDAGAAALGLKIDPAWRETIRLHLGISLDLAASVDAFALPDDADPAPVFTV